jgi:7,8-dihydropterin-6-yl-methyl-4-(beta-D-ribofuranosyl)aminobenzene 5'-phosphate synthase
VCSSNNENESGEIKLTILYDNYIAAEGTKTDWGFSCLIEGTEKTILFDTGTKSDILLHNIKKLNVDIGKIEQIVLSHEHGDHTGGLFSILEKKSDAPVYIPASFSDAFVNKVKNAGATAIRVDMPMKLCENVHLTGEVKGPANEHAVIIDTSKGLVVITGCAHPGIARIVKKARDQLEKDVYFVLGGFHLMDKSENQINDIIQQFKAAGVIKCGATHCTGDEQIKMFSKAYGKNYVEMGVGRIITLPE